MGKWGKAFPLWKDACLVWIFCLPCELSEYSGKEMLWLVRLVHFKGIGLEALSGALESQLELLLSPFFPSLFKAEWLYRTCQLASEGLGSINAGTWGSSSSFHFFLGNFNPWKTRLQNPSNFNPSKTQLGYQVTEFALTQTFTLGFGTVLTDGEGCCIIQWFTHFLCMKGTIVWHRFQGNSLFGPIWEICHVICRSRLWSSQLPR